MIRAPAIVVPAKEAEATRRRLQAEGILRDDLKVARHGDNVAFPVTQSDREAEFEPRQRRPRDYTEFLPETMREAAPRAHDVLGDIVIVKIPTELWHEREQVGDALRRFHGARAVFHDHGVKGEFRTRDLELLAGDGETETTIAENGVRLVVDPAAAYFSPRLGEERRRMTELCRGHVIDLFGGVAPLGVQLAKSGCEVVSVDLNPAACALARRNAMANGVEVEVHCGDAREVAAALAPADHVAMNLPHGAKHFIAAGAGATAPGGMLHHHEIMDRSDLDERCRQVVEEIASLGRTARVVNTRVIRDYSTTEAHFVMDVEIA